VQVHIVSENGALLCMFLTRTRQVSDRSCKVPVFFVRFVNNYGCCSLVGGVGGQKDARAAGTLQLCLLTQTKQKTYFLVTPFGIVMRSSPPGCRYEIRIQDPATQAR
jgi:hypothetical protein